MKTTIKSILGILLITIFIMTSCQDNVIEIKETPLDQVIAKNSVAATLIQKTSSKDGSSDNIIDRASCITVNLPITVEVNGIEIIIDSEEDLDVIEDIIDEFDDDFDLLVINFPIIITLSDYSVKEINSFDQLESYIDNCQGENEDDDDIECIDFNYPISFSIYDTNNQLIDTITVENDEEMYHFVDEIEDDIIVNMNFPIVLILSDGTPKEIQNLDQLEEVIEAFKDDCDEDDDNDFDDDDCENCTIEKTKALLLECSWLIDKVINNDNQDITEQYIGYHLTFFKEGIVKAMNNGNYVMGTWEITSLEDRVLVIINFGDLTDFSFTWELYEIEDNNEIDLRVEENRLELTKYCINDLLDLKGYMIDGKWIVALYTDDYNENYTSSYTNFEFTFNENGTVVASKGNDVVDGTWVAMIDNGELKFILNFDTSPFDNFNDEWMVIEYSNGRLELKDEDDSTDYIEKLVFEKIQ